ncbi:GNAT family N-acetyltransferase [Thalassotalea euphylliae]|uniref:GNAT family N-acetyltransferase n=1 Tax=Thalassotalea euphylliae TaxID=1655234 RepID=A0A3E0TTU6_9GAMM|nr:GNAT family N-acetyltransferase [Thalassotalea euphylliae]REL27823.1 GNAT family N-acetyltransferase [Thalassotalea euphylliae]
MDIRLDDLTSAQVIELLEEHLADMQVTSPPESKHALDLDALKCASVLFWTLWDNDQLAGFAACKQLDASHAELKSMRTARSYKNKGVASRLLKHIINDVKAKGFDKLSLETGSMDYFAPARALYQKHGFSYCEPFSDYVDDPNSKFMTLNLRE